MSEIVVEEVTKSYGSVTALDGISLEVPRESAFGLLGTNGAGKTTLLKLLIGHEQPDTGELRIAGLTPSNGVAVRSQVGYLPEKAAFPEAFTGREVLAFHADVRGVSGNSRESKINRSLERVGLADAADRPVGGYSKGMNRRLGLATVLVSDPAVLLLDEPTSGLDPQGINDFHTVVSQFAEETDVTMLFSSHALSEINRMCDRVAILHEGRLKVAGEVEDLRAAIQGNVTLDVWISTEEEMSDAVAELEAMASVESVGRYDEKLRIQCLRGKPYSVLGELLSITDFERFEVREPDIEDVFHKAIGAEAESNSATTNTSIFDK